MGGRFREVHSVTSSFVSSLSGTVVESVVIRVLVHGSSPPVSTSSLKMSKLEK